MNKKWFSLVELIVGITISIVLMVWVWVLISGWINNVVLQEKVLWNQEDFRDFSKDLLSLFSRIDSGSWKFEPKWLTSTQVLVKVLWNYDQIWVSFIWEEIKDSYYCSWSDLEDSKTKHIIVKNFLPFEEIWEDIFNNFNNTLSWTDNWFKSFYKEHIIKDDSNNIIVWKDWIFGYQLWEYWTWTYLNNPTGLAYDSYNNLLYISDTGNNRILVYDTNTKKIDKLLDEKDWLNEPTWLSLSWSSVLFISNSWNWEILEYLSKSSSKKSIS